MECLWNLQLPLQTAHTRSLLDCVAPSSSHKAKSALNTLLFFPQSDDSFSISCLHWPSSSAHLTPLLKLG
ncbi:hypothetical protein Bca101_026309 [Brassica carinata]